MMFTKNMKFIIYFIIIIAGIVFLAYASKHPVYETFTGSSCPNILVKNEKGILLYNTNRAHVPGVNPVTFENLEEYKEFIDWQRSQGIRCPVLTLQKTNDTQSQPTYRILPDFENSGVGLPPSDVYGVGQQTQPVTKLLDAGHNEGSYPGFDPLNQYIGEFTPLDQMQHERSESDNPMDANWGGQAFTEEAIESGKFAGDTRTL